MDILNWIYIKTQGLIKTTASNADTDLIAVGGQVPFTTRDDGYQTYGMTIKDLSVAGDVANTGYYTLDISQPPFEVTVNTTKGIIDIINTAPGPLSNFGSSYSFFINNSELDLTVGNRDNIYVQYSVHYSQAANDNVIPYLVSTGFIPSNGIGFNLFNANPAMPLLSNWTGALYVYYELYTIN